MVGFSRLGPSIQFPSEARAPCPRVVDPEENLPSLHFPLRGLLSGEVRWSPNGAGGTSSLRKRTHKLPREAREPSPSFRMMEKLAWGHQLRWGRRQIENFITYGLTVGSSPWEDRLFPLCIPLCLLATLPPADNPGRVLALSWRGGEGRRKAG